VAWHNQGNAFIVGLPFRPPQPGEMCEFPDLCGIGIAIYQSTASGRTWKQPVLIHEGQLDDKQCAAGDTNPSSPFYAATVLTRFHLRPTRCISTASEDRA
jgi:hypothetical protein